MDQYQTPIVARGTTIHISEKTQAVVTRIVRDGVEIDLHGRLYTLPFSEVERAVFG
jgi:hypothetical protein